MFVHFRSYIRDCTEYSVLAFADYIFMFFIHFFSLIIQINLLVFVGIWAEVLRYWMLIIKN